MPSPSPDRGLRAAARRLAYPTLLLAVVACVVVTLRCGLDPGPVSFAFLLGCIAYLALLERLIPHEPRWQASAGGWRQFGFYVLLTLAGGGAAQAAVLWVFSTLAAPAAAWPLWAEMPLALLASSLAGYGFHRLSHSNPWLWRLHGIHHVPDKVNVSNNPVNHIADVLAGQLIGQSVLVALGFSQPALLAVGLFTIAQGQFVHANIDVRIGWLNHVLASPEQHRLHHSVDLSEAGHFGSEVSIWDRCFGSFTWHPQRVPAAIGLRHPDTFPRTGQVLASLLHPWRARKSAGGQPP